MEAAGAANMEGTKTQGGGVKGPRGPLPNEVHAVLSPDEVRDGRLIVIGDIHGCCDEFLEMLDKCRCGPADVVVLLGDLVNKGPKSAEVVRAAREGGCLAVRGNHDDAALAAYERVAAGEGAEEGKTAWVSQMAPEDATWLRELPFTLRIPSHNILVVHAGLLPGLPLDQQPLAPLLTMRYIRPQTSGAQAEPATWQPCAAGDEGARLWGPEWRGGDHVFFGHDAARGLQLHGKVTGLDSGCVYGNELSACILPRASQLPDAESCHSPERPLGGELVHVIAHRIYQQPDG